MLRWYLFKNKQQYGPFSFEQLQIMARQGQLLKTDMICQENHNVWAEAKELPNLFSYPSSKKSGLMVLLAVSLVVLVFSVIAIIFIGFLYLSYNDSKQTTEIVDSLDLDGNINVGRKGQLSLGENMTLITETIGSEGGEIHINISHSTIDGFSVNIPEGAYEENVSFVISETPIEAHDFGDDFNPITPLITLNNQQIFSYEPLLVRIPIDKSDDEFAMGFYYDRETGELEGIPFVSLTNQEIVLMTCHFSDIVVSKVKKKDIQSKVESGFIPGVDTFQMPNYGSYAAPGGHCAGQSIGAMYYFNYIKNHPELRGSGEKLWGQYDNNSHLSDAQKTPEFWLDDSYVIRLSSVLQRYLAIRWRPSGLIRADSASYKVFLYKQNIAKNDALTYYAFAYSMQMTLKPQFIYIAQSERVQPVFEKGLAHAMIVYKVENNTLYIADPNYEKDFSRSIALIHEQGLVPTFEMYDSGATSAESGIRFDEVGYFGVSALIDETMVADGWRSVISGQTMGDGFYPDDIEIEVALSKDNSGNLITKKLTDGLVITSEGTLSLGTNMEGMLYMRPLNPHDFDLIRVYFGMEYENYFYDNQWLKIKLEEGNNDIGIFHLKKTNEDEEVYHYVNFTRFLVSYQDNQVDTIEPDPTENISSDYDDLLGTWRIELSYIDSSDPDFYAQVGSGFMEFSLDDSGDLIAEVEGVLVQVEIQGNAINMILNQTHDTMTINGSIYEDFDSLIIMGEAYTEGESLATGKYWSKYSFYGIKEE